MADGGADAAVKRLMAGAARAFAADKLDHALAAYAKVLELDPRHPDALCNMGVCLRRMQRFPAAVGCYRRALEVRPEGAAIWSNLGNAYRDLGRLDEAEAALRKACAISDQAPDTVFNLGLVLKDAGRFGEGLELLERVLAEKPDHAGAAWDRALLLLESGDFARGFEAYEARWKRPDARKLNLATPRWNGGDIAGKTLLLVREQGFGDMIQFARFAAEARARCARLVLECQSELLRLMATAPGVDAVTSDREPPPAHDVHLPMLSLPRVLGTRLESLVAEVPYLRPPQIAKPVPQLQPGFRVGIAWAGKPSHRNDRNRSCPPQRFLDLFDVPGVRIVNLQKGPAARRLTGTVPAALLPDLAAGCDDFADTAALMQALDLVITVDTAVAHLAGALGRPVWVLLPYVPDWRWMRDRDDSPWYPSMRLFRRNTPGDWDGLFARLTAALAEAAAAHPSPADAAS